MLPWGVAVVALLLGCAAWARAGRVARKLEALNQSYWELRYDFTRVRSHLARLDPETQDRDETPPLLDDTVAFVPISSMRKKE